MDMRKLVYIVMICLMGFGCRESERDDDTLTNTTEENAFAEGIFYDAFKMVNEVALNTAGISRSDNTDTTLFGCDQIIVDTTASPKTVFIDFKFKGCVASYGVSRKGRIIAEFTGTYPDSNSIINILFLNYQYADYQINGNIIIVNRGTNEAGNRYLTFFMEDGTVATDRSVISWQANKSWELVEGASSEAVSDDAYLVSGTSFGMNRNGNEYDTEIKTRNRVTNGCFHLSEGTTAVQVKNLSLRTVNYGSGSCDRNAVVTINGKDRNITLPQ